MMIDHLLYVTGLTLLSVSCFTEWETRKTAALLPQKGKFFSYVSKNAAFAWLGFSVAAFFYIEWYYAFLFLLVSMAVPALSVRRLIIHAKSVTIYGGVIGFFLCSWALAGLY